MRRADGSWDSDLLYVNIVNLFGPISKVEKNSDGVQFQIRVRNIGLATVKIDPRTEVADYEGRRETFSDNPIELKEGRSVRVIGRRLKDGSVLAATIVTP